MDDTKEQLEKINIKLDMVVTALLGNIEDVNKPGVVLRVDRLEQSNKTKNRFLWIFGSGLIGLILEKLRTWL